MIPTYKTYSLSNLRELEAEAIFIIREVAAQFENPVILFSGGKDSILLTHLAKKAFYPAKIPFPLVHIDTGHNFPETIERKTMLSIPRMISKKVNVNSASNAFGVNKISIL